MIPRKDKRFLLIAQVLFVAFAFIGNAHAQLDYQDDVLPVVREKSKHVSYPLLLEFQRQNPKHANTYYQLGLIADEYAREYDPFTEYKDVSYFIYHTKVYLGLCKNYMDKKEARKNGDFYQGISKSDDNWFYKPEDIIPVLDERMAAIETYEENVNILRKYYNRSVRHYQECVNIFRKINASQNKIKTIYMTAYDDFDERANALRQHFDSTMYYLDKYREALNAYPLEGYDQQYRLKAIKTYRLQGLTNSNFLQDDITLWNYSGWLDSTYQVINQDVKTLRNAIEKTSAQMERHINYLRRNQAPDSLLQYSLPRKLAFKIEKYDYQSLMLDYLKYRAAKLRYRAWLAQPQNERGFYEIDDEYSQYADYFMKAVERKQGADSLLGDFYRDINEKDIYKYRDFFHEKHGKADGLNQFAKNEHNNNKDVLKESLSNLRSAMTGYVLKFPDDTTTITYKEKNLRLRLARPALADSGDHAFQPVDLKKHNGFFYFTGYYGEGNATQAYVAAVDKDRKLRWLKILPRKKKHQVGLQIDAGANNVFVMAGQFDALGKIQQSHLYKFNKEGKLLSGNALAKKRTPRYLIYDDINQTLLMAFKDTTLQQNGSAMDTLSITMQGASLDTLHWVRDFQLQGNLVDVLRMDTTYHVICNYAAYKVGAGTEVRGNFGSDIAAALSAKISSNGNMLGVKDYRIDPPFFLVKAVKINSDRINLQGVQTFFYPVKGSEPAGFHPIFYALINKEGKVLFNNLQQNSLE